MKKINKKILMGICGLLLFPGIVNAASISFDKSTSENNLTKIPLYVNISEDEQINQIKIGACETGNDSLNCSYTASTNFIVNDNLFISPNGNISSGKIQLGFVVLENTGGSKQSNVTLKLNDIKGLDQGTEVVSLENVERTGIEVKVKAEEPKTSSDSKLSNIEFNQGNMSPEFSSDKLEYTIYGISDTINSIKVKNYTCNDGTVCNITVSGGTSTSNKTVYLARGENEVKVMVTSSDGTKNTTYKFTVFRGQTGFNSSKLSSLSFGEYTLTPVFDKDTTEYTVTVPNQVNSVDAIMKYTTEDSSLASENVVKDGTDNLVVGENTLKITVKNTNGDDQTVYIVKVIRQDNKSIKLLSYKDNNVVFYNEDGEKTTLSAEDFKAKYNDEWLKIANKEYKFDEDGNLIENAEIVESNKDEKKKSGNSLWIIILLIVGGIAIIAVSGYFIFRKKPEKKVDSKKEEIDETGIEEEIISNENESSSVEQTVEIDEALSDLLDTKSYDFTDKE